MSKEEGFQASSHTPQTQYHHSYPINELSKARLIQKTVVYVIGLSSALANKDVSSIID